MFLSVSEAAFALTIGPAQTKRERVAAVREPSLKRTPLESKYEYDLYEQIEESFLKENFSDVDRLAAQYLSGHTRTQQSDEVLYLQSRALLKLDRLTEGREKLLQLKQQSPTVEMKTRASVLLDAVHNFQPLRQIAVEERSFFWVQVGSFSKQQNAQRLLNRLLRSRYESYIKKDAARRMFRVCVGKLTTRQEAFTLEQRLKKDGYPTKIFP